MPTRVLIIEDEPELLQRFADAILSEPTFCLVGAVTTGGAAMELLERVTPQVVLVDLGLPDVSGIEIIRQVAVRYPTTDVLVVTMFGDDQHVLASIEAGASGYLLKDVTVRAIVEGIHQIRNGGSPISPTIARGILARLRGTTVNPLQSHARAVCTSPLTARETDILRLVSKGLSFDEVSASLGVSTHTVVAHVKKIYRKLAVHSRSEAVYEASQQGLL